MGSTFENGDGSDSGMLMFEVTQRKKGKKKRNHRAGRTDEKITETANTYDDSAEKELVESEDSTENKSEVTYKKKKHRNLFAFDSIMKTPPSLEMPLPQQTLEEPKIRPPDEVEQTIRLPNVAQQAIKLPVDVEQTAILPGDTEQSLIPPGDTEQTATLPGDIEQPVIRNRRALSESAKTYELDTFEKNYMIIFNQMKIVGFPERLGHQEDVEALKYTFEKFGFEITVYDDRTKDEIFNILDTFKTQDFTDYGCVAIVVLTHGNLNGTEIWAKDKEYHEEEIIEYLKVNDKPTLMTKPKVLIIQASQAGQFLQTTLVKQSSMVKKDAVDDKPYTLPVMVDVLIVHSSYIEQLSTEDNIRGPWFIKTLCEKINEKAAREDLASILDEVKREVAGINYWEDEYCNVAGEIDRYRQIPRVTSMLIRKLYLKKFGDIPQVTFIDHPTRTTSMAVEVPPSPMLVHFGPCDCFLDHFVYIKRCLGFFIEENPEDLIAQTFLDICNTFEDGVNFNATKERMRRAICQHLIGKAENCSFFRYIYFYDYAGGVN